MVTKKLKDFTIVNGEVYHWDSGGVLAGVLPLLKKNKSYIKSMSCLVTRTISAYIDPSGTEIHWLEMVKDAVGI